MQKTAEKLEMFADKHIAIRNAGKYRENFCVILDLWFIPFLFRNVFLEESKRTLLNPLKGRKHSIFISTMALFKERWLI